MREVNVLSIQRSSAAERTRIEAVDPGVRLIDAGGWFDGEIRETWSDFAAARYMVPGSRGEASREERDRLLGQAEVIIGGWPFPLDMRARALRPRRAVQALAHGRSHQRVVAGVEFHLVEPAAEAVVALELW